MKLSDTLDEYPAAVQFFVEIVETGALVVDGDRLITRLPTMSYQAFQCLQQATASPADKIEIYSFGKLVSEGVKLLRPRQDQLEMLEEMRLNVTMADYVQPFRTLCMEFPESYYGKKCVRCPQDGQWMYGERKPAKHEPGYVVVRQEERLLLLTVVFSSNLSIKVSLIPGDGNTIEEHVEAIGRSGTWTNTMEVTDEEWVIVRACIRSALNYCLLLDEVGCSSRGHVRSGKPHSAMVVPELYELNQEVTLHRTVQSTSDLLPELTGRVMPPHHRRGHYRMQRSGEGLSERKRIRISPVFVNAYLFLGKASDAKATYKG